MAGPPSLHINLWEGQFACVHLSSWPPQCCFTEHANMAHYLDCCGCTLKHKDIYCERQAGTEKRTQQQQIKVHITCLFIVHLVTCCFASFTLPGCWTQRKRRTAKVKLVRDKHPSKCWQQNDVNTRRMMSECRRFNEATEGTWRIETSLHVIMQNAAHLAQLPPLTHFIPHKINQVIFLGSQCLISSVMTDLRLKNHVSSRAARCQSHFWPRP